ncbi:hypothetical protein [Candidatus Reidiella endopervernicosa]|uniref:Uncharacterized protein n=1 Tax=Candidatus Reidiella endopervernicosa TaxID=2738883 RepID=A0A6N0HUW2_9GAMM|nr:hypothetical protein [Candidatus Reidiella endopervernicosa]QKQ26175.1 hypothetical protein HUE57_07655 [Candidatus Reidiella endopervernicosa]
MAKRKETKPDNEICFTIMPFGGWFDNYYLKYIHMQSKSQALCPVALMTSIGREQ